MRVALTLSYLTIICHIAYNTLSHVCIFYILGGGKCTYVISTSRCIYTCPVSSGMHPRHKWFERSDLNPPRKRLEFGGWSFHDRIAVWPEKTEVTMCKQAQRECAGRLSALSPSVNMHYHKHTQQSFTSLVNHMNWSNTGHKLVLTVTKKCSMQEKSCSVLWEMQLIIK